MKAVLLDLDDTILDYSGGVDESWARAVRETLAGGGGPVAPETLIATVATSRRWFWDDPTRHRQERTNMLRAWQRIVAHALDSLRVPRDGLDAVIAERFAAHRREVMRLFPESRAALERLRAGGLPLGLVTNGDARQQRDKIERHDLARYFDVIVIEGEFGAGKPDEAVFRHALRALDTRPEESVMVGDNLDFDVEGSRRLGIHAVWIDRARAGLPPDSPARPDRIVASLEEIEALT